MNHQGDNFTRLQELQNDVSETEAQLEEKNGTVGILE